MMNTILIVTRRKAITHTFVYRRIQVTVYPVSVKHIDRVIKEGINVFVVIVLENTIETNFGKQILYASVADCSNK